MDSKRIDVAMQELANRINYDADSRVYLRKAMCVTKEGDYFDANYSNNSLATVGDAVLKLLLSDYLFSMG